MAGGLPLVVLLQALGLARSWAPHGGALDRRSRAPAAPLKATFAATGDGADILPAAAMDNPVLARVARAAVAAVTNARSDGEGVGSTWVPEVLREEFRASVRGLRFDHRPGDGRFEALYAAAGRDAESAFGCKRGARLARLCGGRHWDMLVYLFPQGAAENEYFSDYNPPSASPPGPVWAGLQPEGTIQLLKPLIGEWERAIDKRAGRVKRRAQVRQMSAGAGGDLGGAVKLHGGPVREFSGVGGAPCALFEVMLKRPVTNNPPSNLPLLELTPDLARAFYDDGGAAPAARAEPQAYQYAGTAPAPIRAPDGSTWEPEYNPQHGEYYFVNSVTGEASWEPSAAAAEPQRNQYAGTAPAPIRAPDGSTWAPHYDEGERDYYFVNSVTGEASWEPPAAAAEPQRNQNAGTAPAPISAPDGSTWEPHYDEGQGEYFYVNSATGEASWLNS